MAPNVFFNITLLQRMQLLKMICLLECNTGLFLLEWWIKNTILILKISMPAVLKPEQEFNVQVSEQAEK
jgi:hypothetical protein